MNIYPFGKVVLVSQVKLFPSESTALRNTNDLAMLIWGCIFPRICSKSLHLVLQNSTLWKGSATGEAKLPSQEQKLFLYV